MIFDIDVLKIYSYYSTRGYLGQLSSQGIENFHRNGPDDFLKLFSYFHRNHCGSKVQLELEVLILPYIDSFGKDTIF